jgi:hypothetical protein
MTTRIFENENTFEVSSKHENVEFARWNDVLHVITCEDYAYNSQRTQFVLTREEATALKIFLEKQGF